MILETSLIAMPMKGQTASGDGHLVLTGGPETLLVVLDGLGHGPVAADVVATALPHIEKSGAISLDALFQELDGVLAGSRGAVIAAARINPSSQSLTWAAVGDVQGVIVHKGGRSTLVGKPGILGYHCPRVNESIVDFPYGSILCLATDGVDPGFASAIMPGRSLEDNARQLQRCLRPERDDCLILLARLITS